MKVVILQGQQVPFIKDPIELGKGIPGLLFDIDGAIFRADGETKLVLHDIDDLLDTVFRDLQCFLRCELGSAAVVEIIGTERDGIGILIVGDKEMDLIFYNWSAEQCAKLT